MRARGMLKGGEGILRRALIYAVQPAVGKIPPVKRGLFLRVAPARGDQERRRSRGGRGRAGGDERRFCPFI